MIEPKLVYPFMITVINIVILGILIVSFRKHYIGRRNDANFHTRMLLLCTCLLLANTFALVTGVYGYFILRAYQPEILNFGRFADRYCMLFAYLALDKIDER